MISEHKFIKLRDGIELHSEIKEKGHNVWLIATHGIGEHLGRHHYLQELFNHEFNICQYDLRGHGRSHGERAYVEDFSLFMEDLEEIIEFLKEHYYMKRYVLFGHSMGALITAGYLQNYAKQDFYPERAFLSAPPVGFGGSAGEIVRYTPKELISGILKLPLSIQLGGFVDLDNLSHDSSVRVTYEEDELNCQRLHTKLVLEMVKASKDIFSRPLRSHCPTYCAIGSGDQIVSVSQAKEYFEEVEKAVILKVIEGAYHEMHNEVKRYREPYFSFLKEVMLECLYGIRA